LGRSLLRAPPKKWRATLKSKRLILPVEGSEVLVIENLNVYYAKAHVLKNVTLRVPQGEFVSIIGPNGAGKTTLFRTISG
jgi:ABC-type molybdenum transport system ATPase subunit/photorepair protein PhrA